eukprot:TRINITY_DN74575_c0_g1_i1.p1 TRINITY_DN74575_c0_g1~~TRINITY_DN74575_c0_g1_i1.p1  ORF type:complete len:393 (+),score=58.15 TRINITY_DN74575_c0_g1_i1:99-1277(+)
MAAKGAGRGNRGKGQGFDRNAHADGGPRLVVRNTFLQFDDEQTVQQGRRPRANTDLTDSKLPQKIGYPLDPVLDSENGGVVNPLANGGLGNPLMYGGIPPFLPGVAPGGFDPTYGGLGPLPWGLGGAGMPVAYNGMMPPFFGSYAPSPLPFTDPSVVQADAANGALNGSRGPPQQLQQRQPQQNQQREKGGKDKGGKGEKGGKSQMNGKGGGGMYGGAQDRRSDMSRSHQGAPSRPEDFPGGRPSTVMLRNIPNRYTQDMILQLLDSKFTGRFDFAYLPMDFRKCANLGYAFVNLLTHEDAVRFIEVFQGFDQWMFDSSKVGEVSWAHPHQGLQEHVERYRNSPVMHQSMPDDYKPMVFKDGVRVPFPPPTKPISAPKLRPVRERGATGAGA